MTTLLKQPWAEHHKETKNQPKTNKIIFDGKLVADIYPQRCEHILRLGSPKDCKNLSLLFTLHKKLYKWTNLITC